MPQRDPAGGWRSLTYAEAFERVRALGQALLDRKLSLDRPLAILSENDVEHLLLTLAAIVVLAYAVATGASVAIRYRSSSGGVTDRVISDLVLVGGYLHAWCHLRGAERYFALENVLSVAPA